MDADPKPFFYVLLAVLVILFCAVAGVLYVRHVETVSKKGSWTVSLRPSESRRMSAQSKSSSPYEANDEELVDFRRRLERKAWEVAQAKENEAAKREGREPVQIVVGSDIPAILKYYGEQNAAQPSKETSVDPAVTREGACSSRPMDTASAEALSKSLSGSVWKFSSPSWRNLRLEFYDDGGYMTSSGIVGQWNAPAADRIVMKNTDGIHQYAVTVSSDGIRFNGQRNDGLSVFASLVCEERATVP